MRSLATLTKDQSLEVCFQCHAVKASLEPGYLPGKLRDRHFAMKLPILLDTIYHADGRTRVFAYQEGHLSSDCYLNGSMTCVDCHDPHSQRYRDVNGASLPGRFDDGQCVDCHASKAEPITRHTHHASESAGSRCVSCHMPYLQEPSVGPRVRYARSDHTIPIPRPSFDARLGIENACAGCHRDRTIQDLDAQVGKWFGALKPHPAMVGAVAAADTAGDPATVARTIASAHGHHPMADVMGMSLMLKRYATPDVAALDAATTERLEQLAGDSDLDVSALALASLHQLRGADPQVRRFLARALDRLGDREALVRSRWVWILRVRGEALLASGDFRSALTTYRKALEIAPADPTIWRSLGVTNTRLHDYPKAIEAFQRSLSLRPRQPQVLVELGFALAQRGQPDSAIATFRQAIDLDPWDPGAYANLGVVSLRRGAVRAALEPLERAVQLNPGLAEAHFALASAYGQLGERERALEALERGLEFDPGNAAARRLLDSQRR
jgi:tetratricopeptide (TPR) repeat protein